MEVSFLFRLANVWLTFYLFMSDRAEPGQQGQGPPRQLRMLTLLIADIRSGVTDHQLAEVRVPLRDHSGYYWADAQDVCEQLQSSPSRIDGKSDDYMTASLLIQCLTYRACKSLHHTFELSAILSASIGRERGRGYFGQPSSIQGQESA